MLNPKTTRMVVHTSLNVSLLIIATMVLINEVYERLQILNITMKGLILSVLFVITN